MTNQTKCECGHSAIGHDHGPTPLHPEGGPTYCGYYDGENQCPCESYRPAQQAEQCANCGYPEHKHSPIVKQCPPDELTSTVTTYSPAPPEASTPNAAAVEARDVVKSPQQIAYDEVYHKHSFEHPDACKYDGCKEFQYGFNLGYIAATQPHTEVRETVDREAIYPCAKCGVLRTKAEGGTCFTVCDECWADNPADLEAGTMGYGFADPDFDTTAAEWFDANYQGFRYLQRPDGVWEFILTEPIIVEMLQHYGRLAADLEAGTMANKVIRTLQKGIRKLYDEHANGCCDCTDVMKKVQRLADAALSEDKQTEEK